MGGCKNSNLLTCLKTLPTGCTGRNLDIRTHVTCAVPMYGGRGPKSCNSAKSAKSRLVDLAVPSENETPQKTEVQASKFPRCSVRYRSRYKHKHTTVLADPRLAYNWFAPLQQHFLRVDASLYNFINFVSILIKPSYSCPSALSQRNKGCSNSTFQGYNCQVRCRNKCND